MSWLKEHWFKMGILLVLLLVIGLLAYYFMIFIPKKDLDEKAAIDFQDSVTKMEKENCVTSSETTAINEYESSALCDNSNPYAPATCSDGITYIVSQYNNAYDVCLQSKGLK